MANQIRITPDALRNEAELLRSCAVNLLSEVARLRDVLERMNTSWSGSANDFYICDAVQKIIEIDKLAEILLEMAEQREHAARTVEETDMMIASLFRG